MHSPTSKVTSYVCLQLRAQLQSKSQSARTALVFDADADALRALTVVKSARDLIAYLADEPGTYLALRLCPTHVFQPQFAEVIQRLWHTMDRLSLSSHVQNQSLELARLEDAAARDKKALASAVAHKRMPSSVMSDSKVRSAIEDQTLRFINMSPYPGAVLPQRCRELCISQAEAEQIFASWNDGRMVTSVLEPWRGQKVVLQVVGGDINNNPALQEKFREEALLVQKLVHPNLLPIFGVLDGCGVTSDDVPSPYFTITPLVHIRWSDLIHVPTSGVYSMSENGKLLVMCQVAEAVFFLHSRKPQVLHLHLTPCSILLTDDMVPRLQILNVGSGFYDNIDRDDAEQITPFQHCPPRNSIYLVRFILNFCAEQQHHVTPQAPEAFNRQMSDKCDVYALGVIIWESFALMRPFHELPTSADVRQAIFNGTVPNVAQVPAYLAQLLLSCWIRGTFHSIS